MSDPNNPNAQNGNQVQVVARITIDIGPNGQVLGVRDFPNHPLIAMGVLAQAQQVIINHFAKQAEATTPKIVIPSPIIGGIPR